MRKKMSKKAITIVAFLTAVAFAACAGLSVHRNRYYDWAERMMALGPWAGCSLWISEDERIYILATEEGDGLAATSAYIDCGEGWRQCEVNWISGVRTLEFRDATSDELVLSGSFDINKNSEMSLEIETALDADFWAGESITIQKHPYDENLIGFLTKEG